MTTDRNQWIIVQIASSRGKCGKMHIARFRTLERVYGRESLSMTKEEASRKLRLIGTQCSEILRLLDQLPTDSVSESVIRDHTTALKQELEWEYHRVRPERAQRSMTIFELSVYSPTIEEAWKESGIRRLKVEGKIDWKWRDVIESVAYKVSKYLAYG